MSLHRSLKTKPSALNQHRNVLTRTERIARLTETERFKSSDNSPLGLVKVANRMIVTKKEKKETAADATATTAAAPAAGGKGAAAPAAAAKPDAKGAAPAKAAAPAAKGAKK